MWTIKKDNSQKWYLQFDDEFNANELDQKNWRNGYPWGNVIMNLDLIYYFYFNLVVIFIVNF
jgi:hypothetical protein